MEQENQGSGTNPQSKSELVKRPYRKPEFRHERVFETSALACGKVQIGPTCASQKKNS
jgi:hypothetical protein